MELALYCPDSGYYEKEEDTIGRSGDYYTSVSVGSLFSELLAFQFAQWLEEEPDSKKRAELSNSGSPAHIVEAGAHNGHLASDVLGWLRENRPSLFERMQYWIVEPSLRRQERQRAKLSSFERQVRWSTDIGATAGPLGLTGVFFANELLDAMPVHRLGWDASRQKWFEWGVGLSNGHFEWQPMPAPPVTWPSPAISSPSTSTASATSKKPRSPIGL